MAWTTPASVTVGQLQTSAGWNAQVKENWDASFPDAVTVNSWNVTLEGESTDPTVSTDEGREYVIGAVQFCWARFDDFSSGGLGDYFVTLPSTASGVTGDSGVKGQVVGNAIANESGGGQHDSGVVMLGSTTTVKFASFAGANWGATNPINTWAANDTLTMTAAYPIST